MTPKEMFAQIDRLAKFAENPDFQGPLQDVEQILLKGIASNFNAERDPGGTAWSPRKQPTGGWPILVKTGKMLGGSLGPRGAGFATGPLGPTLDGIKAHKRVLAPTSMKFVNTVKSSSGYPYPWVHQKGSVKVPARPFFGVPEEYLKKARKLFNASAKKLLLKIKKGGN